jgi:hypothetical protein
MKSLLLALTLLTALACAHTSSAPAAQPALAPAPSSAPAAAAGPAPTLLVLPLRAAGGVQGPAQALDGMILAAISGTKRYQTLGADDLNALLGVEKMKDALGCDDVSCAAQIGGALGAPYLVAGDLSPLGDEVVLSLRLMDTRAARVLARGTARGTPTADALSTMMAQAVGDLLGIPVQEAAHVHAAPPSAPLQYDAYVAMVTKLGKRVSNFEYAGLLEDVDAYEKKPPTAPPGTDPRELLLFYRAFACYSLQRVPCLEQTARGYLAQYPGGTYAQTLQTYLDQLDSSQAQQQERDEQLRTQLATLQEQRDAGRITEEQAMEMSAYACLGALAYARASALFEQLMARAGADDERWFTLAEQRVLALQQAAAFDEARTVLLEAQRRNPRLFRARGMNGTLSRLPR